MHPVPRWVSLFRHLVYMYKCSFVLAIWQCLSGIHYPSPKSGCSMINDLPVKLHAMIFASIPDYDNTLSLGLTSSHFWHVGKTYISSMITKWQLFDHNNNEGIHKALYWSGNRIICIGSGTNSLLTDLDDTKYLGPAPVLTPAGEPGDGYDEYVDKLLFALDEEELCSDCGIWNYPISTHWAHPVLEGTQLGWLRALRIGSGCSNVAGVDVADSLMMSLQNGSFTTWQRESILTRMQVLVGVLTIDLRCVCAGPGKLAWSAWIPSQSGCAMEHGQAIGSISFWLMRLSLSQGVTGSR